MVSIFQEIDINHVFNHFAQNKCSNHKKRIASSVCLHEDCWKSKYDKAFFCVDCIMNHTKEHGNNSIRCNALFTNELFDELNEFENDLTISDKLEEKVSKFDQKTNELYSEVEQWTKCQFSELKKFIESHLRENLIIDDNLEAVKNLKEMLSQARIDLSWNHESNEHLKSYFTKIEKIQNDLNNAVNGHVIIEKKNDEMDGELDLKLQQMINEIKDNVKDQVNRLVKGFICE